MKKTNYLFSILLCLLFQVSAFAQADCEVFCTVTNQFYNVCNTAGQVIAAENCADAVLGTVADLDGFETTTCGLSPDGPGGLIDFCGPGTDPLENNVWIGLTPAVSGRLHLNIEIIDCLNPDPSCNGIQAAFARALCQNPGNEFFGFEYQTLDCVNCVDQTFDLITINAIAGLPHYLMIDGCCGDVCEIRINVIEGLGEDWLTTAQGDICEDPFEACYKEESFLRVGLKANTAIDQDYNFTCEWLDPANQVLLTQTAEGNGTEASFEITGLNPQTGQPYICDQFNIRARITEAVSGWTHSESFNPQNFIFNVDFVSFDIDSDNDCLADLKQIDIRIPSNTQLEIGSWFKLDYSTTPPTRTPIVGIDQSNESTTIDRSDPDLGAGDYLFVGTFMGQNCVKEIIIPVAFNNDTCIADAGFDQVIDCQVASVLIDGSGSCGSSELLYEWTDEFGQVLSNGPTLEVLIPGIYTLQITDPALGCTDTDQVIITDDLRIPSLSFEYLNGTGPFLTCESTVAEILAISTDTPNAFFEWTLPSGQTTTDNPIITNEAGVYILTAIDLDNGCFNQTSLNLVEDDLCTKITGFAYIDLNSDCERQMDEELRGSWLLKFDDGVEPFYRNVPSSGAFDIGMLPGTYEIGLVPLNAIWQSCPPVTVTINEMDIIEMDFGAESIFECDMPVVEMVIPRLRRCIENPIYVCYSNEGSTDALDAYIDVLIDEDHTVVSADLPFETIEPTQIRFQLGTLEPFASGRIEIIVETSCDAVFGKSHCFEAEIFPQNDCFISSDWDGSSLVVEGSQVDDKIRFEVTNIGADMTTSVNGFIIEDDVLMRIETIQLNASNVLPIEVDCSSSTFRIEVEQSPNHPGMSFPTVTVEGCDGEFTPGLVNLFPQDNEDPFKDVVCRANVDSYDPNDKLAAPTGVSDANCIPPGRHLDYTIRFQNTGTAEALKVVITDEISENLDMSTLKITAASHDYTYIIDEGRTLIFTFDDINLPWEAVDEPGSNGFIQYSIFPKENIELGSEVENFASIFFDFNDPIITNTTFHTIDVDCIEVNIVSSTSEQSTNDSAVFPNPFKDAINVVLENENHETLTFKLFDVNGRIIEQFDFDTNQVHYETDKMQAGIYFYEISSASHKLGSGKLIKI